VILLVWEALIKTVRPEPVEGFAESKRLSTQRPSDEKTSHPTRLSKNDNQVVG
jgi:hypothetical protein